MWGLPSGCGDCYQAFETAITLWGLHHQAVGTATVYTVVHKPLLTSLRSTATVADTASDNVPLKKQVDKTFFCVTQTKDEQFFLLLAVKGLNPRP